MIQTGPSVSISSIQLGQTFAHVPHRVHFSLSIVIIPATYTHLKTFSVHIQKKPDNRPAYSLIGSPSKTRTYNNSINSRVLYH